MLRASAFYTFFLRCFGLTTLSCLCYYYYYILSKAPDLGYSQGLFLLVSRVLYLPWKQPSMALENMKIKEKEIENEGAKREHSFNFCWNGEILGCGPTFIRTHRHGIIILFCGPTLHVTLWVLFRCSCGRLHHSRRQFGKGL